MNFIENESPRKLRGGYYTPPDLAAFLARWVLEVEPRRILEPSCGDGAFFEALAACGTGTLGGVVGCEIVAAEAAVARSRATALGKATVSIHATDFLDWHLRAGDRQIFDGVLGNPPFVRYQYLDATLQARAERIFARHRLPFTRHTNAWVPFVIASIARLRPGGRLAMVVPAELLHVLHAQSLRSFLIEQCSRIVVVDPDDLWFEEALQGTVLLLAEKARPGEPRGRLAVVPVAARDFARESPRALLTGAEFVDGSELPRKWMPALLTPRERSLLDAVRRISAVHELGSVAVVDVGIVTGANHFFLVPDATVDEFELHRWAHPMFGRSEHARGVVFDRRAHEENRRLGLPSHFLWFGPRPADDFPESVQRYLRSGEHQGLHRRYKCRIRTPWYNVPSVSAAPVGMLKRSHDFPRLTLNRMKVLTTDTAYRVRPSRTSASRLVLGFVNSLTALSAELEGRHYGGGVLELVPSEIERVLVPLGDAPAGGLARLDRWMRSGVEAERVLASQDAHVLASLSLTRRDADDLRSAWRRLRDRRQRRYAGTERPSSSRASATGITPAPSNAAWKSRGSKRSPARARASSRAATI